MTDSELAVAAALLGAHVVRRWSGRTARRIEKGGGDFATEADVEAEQAIVGLLRSHRPDDAVLGEETGLTSGAATHRCWLVDPLCGTTNVAAGRGLVAVNVVLREASRFVAAAVADPTKDEVLWTDGAGVYRRVGEIDARVVPSSASRFVALNLDLSLRVTSGFRATAMLADPRFVGQFNAQDPSSSLALAWVASGECAAYVSDGEHEPSVHFAAGTALCEAAGCCVSNLAGEALYSGIGGLVAASDASTHAVILSCIARQLGAR